MIESHPLRLSDSDTVPILLERFAEAARELGVIAAMYTMAPPFHSQNGKRSLVVQYGFPPEVVEDYLDPQSQLLDPFPDFIVQHGRTMSWREAIEQFQATPHHLRRFKMLAAAGHPDGVSLPLYGPHNRASYAAFSLGRVITADDAELIVKLLNLGTFYHRKICVAVMRDHAKPITFSKRQSEVLYWIARGKSTPDIATIMGVSPATVDTFIRRIFAKLQVNDRVTAVIEAMTRGLLRF